MHSTCLKRCSCWYRAKAASTPDDAVLILIRPGTCISGPSISPD